MQLIGDKVLIRFTKENKESIFSKWITKEDGTKVKLFLNVDAGYDDERKSKLFVQTGIVEAVGKGRYHNQTGEFLPIGDIQVGDIAIVDYNLCNDLSKLFYREENGDDVFWCNAITIFHKKDEVMYASRRLVTDKRSKQYGKSANPRDMMLVKVGDIEELSSIYGIIRDDELIARKPFVFYYHQNNVINKETKMHIVYTETQTTLTRKILACDDRSSNEFGIKKDDSILIKEEDIFDIKLKDSYIQCSNDFDIICKAI